MTVQAYFLWSILKREVLWKRNVTKERFSAKLFHKAAFLERFCAKAWITYRRVPENCFTRRGDKGIFSGLTMLLPYFSVVLFRPNFMLVSEEYPALHQKSGYSADRSVIEDYQTYSLALK